MALRKRKAPSRDRDENAGVEDGKAKQVQVDNERQRHVDGEKKPNKRPKNPLDDNEHSQVLPEDDFEPFRPLTRSKAGSRRSLIVGRIEYDANVHELPQQASYFRPKMWQTRRQRGRSQTRSRLHWHDEPRVQMLRLTWRTRKLPRCHGPHFR